MSELRIGSLFSGIEGLDLAVQATLGGHVQWYCEAPEIKDPRTPAQRREAKRRVHLLERFKARHPETPLHIGVENVAKLASEIDVLTGGFPCINVSQAGKREGLAGEHSGLWFQMTAIVRELRPRFVVIENVRGLVTRGLDTVLGDLADAGYDAEWCLLGACCVGAPHIRERVFILAWREEIPRFSPTLALHDPGWLDGAWWTDPTCADFPGRRERLAALGNACSPHQATAALTLLLTRAAGSTLPVVERRPGRWGSLWSRWPSSGALRGGWLGVRPETHHTTAECIRDVRGIHRSPLPTPTAAEYGSSGNGSSNNVESRGRPSLDAMARRTTLPTPREGQLLPTPTAATAWNGDCESERRRRSPNLNAAASAIGNLPTPTKQDGYNDGAPSQLRRRTPPLNPVVGTLPTPTAGDARGSGSRNLAGSNAHAGVSLTDAVCRGGSDMGGADIPKLNPVFVERMMGFPDDWSAT